MVSGIEMKSETKREPLRVLLVEDDQAHAELIRRGLEEQPFQTRVDHVEDGEAALDYLRSGPDNPDLILLDIRLPKVSGLDVLRQIRESERSRLIPTVMLTTSDDPGDIEKAYRFRANSYLVKPIDFNRFETLVGGLGLYWSRWNERPA